MLVTKKVTRISLFCNAYKCRLFYNIPKTQNAIPNLYINFRGYKMVLTNEREGRMITRLMLLAVMGIAIMFAAAFVLADESYADDGWKTTTLSGDEMEVTLEDKTVYIMDGNIDSSRIYVPAGRSVRIEMNGYHILGGSQKGRGGFLGAGIEVRENSNLVINGGDKTTDQGSIIYRWKDDSTWFWEDPDYIVDDTTDVWGDNDPVQGAFIGGYAEGIRLYAGATLKMKDVMVGGNLENGIYCAGDNNQTIELKDCIITETSHTSDTSNGRGNGGIRMRGNNSKLILDGTKVTYNYNSNYDNACAAGVCILGDGATIIGRNGGEIVENHGSGGKGGGLSIVGNNSKVKWVKFESNTSYSGGIGGGAYINGNDNTVERAEMHYNESAEQGGALYINGERNKVILSDFRANKAVNDGGAVFMNGEGSSVSESYFYNNMADRLVASNRGGAIFISGKDTAVDKITAENNEATTGGAVWFTGEYSKVKNSTFKDNVGINYGGAVATTEFSAYREIDSCVFEGNKAQNDDGGAIYLENYGDSTIKKCKVKGNWAYDYGGGMFLKGPNIKVRDCEVTDNTASTESGGGIVYDSGEYGWMKDGALEDCVIERNWADDYGGGIYTGTSNTDDKKVFRNLTIRNNKANYGGGIYYTSDNAYISDSLIQGNKAYQGDGNGVYVDNDGRVEVSGKMIVRHNSNGTGINYGGHWSNFYLYDDARLAIENGELSEGADLWLDSEWGRDDDPAEDDDGYIYHDSGDRSLKRTGIHCDRYGYTFKEMNSTLYYGYGTDWGLRDPKLIDISKDFGTYKRDIDPLYISFLTGYRLGSDSYSISVTKKINDGDAEDISDQVVDDAPLSTDRNVFKLPLTGVSGKKVTYSFDIKAKIRYTDPAVGLQEQRVQGDIVIERKTGNALVEISYTPSVGKTSWIERGYVALDGTPTTFDIPDFVVNDPYPCTDFYLSDYFRQVDYPMNEGIDFDRENKKLTISMPDDDRLGNNAWIHMMCVRNDSKPEVNVTYTSNREGDYPYLPFDTKVEVGSTVTVKPLECKEWRTLYTEVNGKKHSTGEAYDVTIYEDTEIHYEFTNKAHFDVAVDYSPRMNKVETHEIPVNKSYKEAVGVSKLDGRSIVKGFKRTIEGEEKTVSVDHIFEEDIPSDSPLKVVWEDLYHVTAVNSVIEGETASPAVKKVGDSVKIKYGKLIPEGQYLKGWDISYTTYDGKPVTEAPDRVLSGTTSIFGGKVPVQTTIPELSFTITDGFLETLGDGTKVPVNITVTPVFVPRVNKILNVPETLYIGDPGFKFADARVSPSNAVVGGDDVFDPKDIEWRDGSMLLGGEEFCPDEVGRYDLNATIADGAGVGVPLIIHYTVNVVDDRKTVTFDYDGGGTNEEKKVRPGRKVSWPDPPHKDGFSFKGWYLGEEEYDFDQPVTDDMTLVAKYDKLWKVTTEVVPEQEGEDPHGTITGTSEYTEGSDVIITATPDTGYAVKYWNDNGTEIENHETTYTISAIDSDHTVKVGFVDETIVDGKLVSLKKAGDGTAYGGGYHNPGENITIGAEPALGHCFYQWIIPEGQTDVSFEDIYTAEQTFTMPDDNIEFTAVFVKSPQNISLTGKAAAQRMRAGTELPVTSSIMPLDTDERLRDIEWSLVEPPAGVSLAEDDGALKLAAGDNTPAGPVMLKGAIKKPNGDVVLEKVFGIEVVREYDVRFIDGENVLDTQVITEGGKVAEIPDPGKEHYYFRGWQKNGEDYDFDAPVTESLDLTSKWEKEKFQVAFISKGKGIFMSEVGWEDFVEQPQDPQPEEGDRFIKWLASDGEDYDFTKPVTRNMNLTAAWLTHVKAVAPTCYKDGNIEYWYSEELGKYYNDAERKNEITKEKTIISKDKAEHEFSDWIDSRDGEHHVRFCIHFNLHGPYQEMKPHTWIEDESKEKKATGTEEGEKFFNCKECSATLSKTIPKLSDPEAAKQVSDMINILPASPKAYDEAAVSKARAAYNALTPAQKALVPKEALDKLVAAEKAVETDKKKPVVPDRKNQKGSDGTAFGKGASLEAAEQALANLKSDGDPAGSKFAPLYAKSTKTTKSSAKVTWKRVSGATKYVVYGNKCGAKNKFKKISVVTGKTLNVKKVAGKKLKKKTNYKFIVIALDGKNNVVSTSKVVHVMTKGGKNRNYTKVKVTAPKKAKKGKLALKAGKTAKLKAKATGKKVKVHRKIRYESLNPAVATVNASSGKVKGVKKGTVTIICYAQNGVYKNVKVTVK